MTSSARSATSSLECSTAKIVRLRSRCRLSMALYISSRPKGSSSEVGSSKTRISGYIARMPAIASLCFSPPESWLVNLPSYPVSRTILSESSMRFRILSVSRPMFPGPKATSSSTVIPNICVSGSCITRPTLDTRVWTRNLCVSIPMTDTRPARSPSKS